MHCKRFIDNCKHRDRHKSITLTVAELIDALSMLAKLAQIQSFLTEIHILKSDERITKGETILS